MNALIETRDLRKHYPITRGIFHQRVGAIKAVDGVNLNIGEGETLGLVGESGCGKSTLGRTLLKLEQATGGRVIYRGEDISDWRGSRLKLFRRQAQMIFQDPQSSLDPRMSVGDSVAEALIIHHPDLSQKEQTERVAYLMEKVGVDPRQSDRYPHQFSGGQKQRIGIARALAVEPAFIVADEPVSALDVSVQAQVLNLLMDLRDEFKLSYLFIAHDLAVIRHISDRIAVMYLGRVVESADRRELFHGPLHPYTIALLNAILVPNPHKVRKANLLRGEVPSPANPPPGCHFHPRCPQRLPVCDKQTPLLQERNPGHPVACHLYD
jgi:peptide/nickel transport system ATP-binding protein/oligopeptide transport system ATP-binding protein